MRPKGECPYCGRENEGNAGDFYHRAQCHQSDVLRRMAENRDERMRLERELERARYVGD